MNTEGNIRDFILSLEKPVVFHNMIDDWNILSWSFENWCSVFGEKKLPFRCGRRQCSPCPQWERQCSTKLMTMKDFIVSQENQNKSKENLNWYYFDYKCIKEWAPEGNVNAFLGTVSWNKFGFPEMNASGSTLWIGSPGAHTPCHVDTYGCNLVAQVHGKKQWILFPPQEVKALRASRVPYEESSVYSQWNFSCPLPPEFFDSVKSVYILTLNPGDVLFVPHHWWHFVENLTLSVSVNTWIPLTRDHSNRVDEALVRFFVSHMSSSLSPDERQYLLNPNEDNLNMDEALDLLKFSISAEKQENSCVTLSIAKQEREGCSKRRKTCSDSIIQFEEPCKSSLEELKTLLDAKCSCNSDLDHKRSLEEEQFEGHQTFIIAKLVNAFCHPETIQCVRQQMDGSL